MLLARKAISFVLLFIVFFSLFATYIGENFQDAYESNEFTPIEGSEDVSRDYRGTRAEESYNVDFLSRILYGETIDVKVVGNYAYVGSGFNLLVIDISDKKDPQLVASEWTFTYVAAIDIAGSLVYMADAYYGLLIFDMSNPKNPVRVGGYQIEEGFTAFDIDVSGSYAYLAVFNTFDLADPDNGIIAIDISTPANPQFAGYYKGTTVTGISVVSSTVYAACYTNGLRIIDMSTPASPNELGRNESNPTFRISVAGDTAFTTGFNFIWPIDISDPTDPTGYLTYEIEDAMDMHVEAVNDIAFIANGGEGLKILDVNDPLSIMELGSHETDDMAQGIFYLGNYAYVADRFNGLVIFDVSTLNSPSEESTFYTGDFPKDIVVEGNLAYVAADSVGLRIYDISDMMKPTEIGFYENLYADGISLRGNYAYITEGDSLWVMDVGNPTNPTDLGFEWLSGFAEDIYLDWPYAYIATGEDGVSIVDVNNPFSPSEITVYTQATEAMGVHVFNNYLFIANGDNGLNIVDVSNPLSPNNVATFPTSDTAMDVFIGGNYAYIAINESGLRIVDVSSPASPSPKSTIDTNGNTMGVFVEKGHAYVADGSQGLRVIDVTNPSNPLEVGFYNTSGYAEDAFVYNGTVYMSSWGGGLYLLDGTNFIPPEISSVLPEPDSLDVPVNTSLIITFTEGMNKISTQNSFSYTDGSQTWNTLDGTVDWTEGDSTLTFLPDSTLDYDVEYTVTIAHTATDKDGNQLDGDKDGVPGEVTEDDFTWSFTTVSPPPNIISNYPEDNAQDIPVDIDIIINFSKPMHKSSVQNAFEYTDGVTVWNVLNGMVSWSNTDKTFTFTPSSELDNNIEYQVTIAYTAMDTDNIFLDADEDGIPGEPDEDNYTFSFRTIPASPQIISTSPQHGSDFILTNTTVQVTFSKSMNKGSVLTALSFTDGIIEFSSSNGVTTWSNEDKTMIFTPYIKFQNEVMYTFTIDHSARDTEDIFLDGDNDGIGGEVDEDDYSWWFKTIPEPPKVTYTSPKNMAVKVPIHSWINITFSKAMDKTSVEEAFSYSYEGTNTTWDSLDGFISWSDNSRTMMFEPQSEFEFEKDYTVRIEASAKDEQGITLDGNKNKLSEGADIDYYRWSFTTTPEPPKILSVLPSENSQDVAVDADIAINFDKSMNKGATEKAFSYTYEGSSETYEIIDGTSEWSDGDRTLTFNPDIDFYEGEKYTVTIESTAKDTDGITFEGYEWSFTVKVNSAPELIGGGVNPEKGDTTDMFTFSIVYRDVDNDKPEKIKVIIDGFEWRMLESDTKVDRWDGDGKSYQYEIELDEGEHTYYFEASDEKHDVRFPQGSTTKKLNVEAKGEELIFGLFEEEYAGLPTLICGPIAIIIIIAIIIVVVMMMRRGRAGEMMVFEAMGEGEAAPMAFLPMPGEDIMSFTTFEEIPSLEEAQPVLIQCPECEQHLRVRTTKRPFVFPCKCGAKLILK